MPRGILTFIWNRALWSGGVIEIDRDIKMSVLRSCAVAVSLALSMIAVAQAQDYPTRPVTLVVAAAAGGPIDVFGRVMAERMSVLMGQRVVIENVGGGGGTLGGQRVVKAEPDGYTALLGTLATHANPQLLGARPLYGPVSDFVPVGLIAEIPLVLITRADFPARTLEEFVAYSKANATKMNYGSAGVGSAAHLGCLMLTTAMGVEITHIPYKGTAPAMQDMLAGRIDFLCDISTSAVTHIQGGKVKALANLASARSPVLPDLPTALERGLKGVEASTWTAIFLPKGTSAAVAEKLGEAMRGAMDTPELRARLEKLGATLVAPDRRSAAYLGDYVKAEIVKWGNAARAGGAMPKE
jgi:tripartite-type tricarboxylate transporter receptor subunit TctC